MANFWELQGEALALMDRIETFRPEGIRILLEALDRERDFDAVFKAGIADYFTRIVNSIYGERRLKAFLAKVRKYDEQRSGLYKCEECGLVTDFKRRRHAHCPDCGGWLEEVGKFYDLLSIGKDKWLWLAWESQNGHFYFKPENLTELAEGIEPSKEAALKKINDLLGEVRWFGGNLRAKTRRKEMSDEWWQDHANHEASDAKPVEYLYYPVYLRHSNTYEWQEVPIIKRTKKRVYIRANKWNEHATVLDRQELEANGFTRGGRYKSRYYNQAGREQWEAERAERVESSVPECFRVLGVGATATLQDIKRAHRKRAQETHPDAGGDSTEFIKVQEAYEQARGLLRHQAN